MHIYEFNSTRSSLLKKHKKIFNNKRVLDLACNIGHSSNMIKDMGALQVTGIDVRENLIKIANEHYKDIDIDFLTGNITDPSLIKPLIHNYNVVSVFGALYHLYDHFNFFKLILRPTIEYVILDTLCGPETTNPEMFWGFENIERDLNGYDDEVSIVPHGIPNLSWIIQVADLFGFSCDYVEKYYDGDDYEAPHCERMFIRLYNRKSILSQSLRIEDIFEWNTDHLIFGE